MKVGDTVRVVNHRWTQNPNIPIGTEAVVDTIYPEGRILRVVVWIDSLETDASFEPEDLEVIN